MHWPTVFIRYSLYYFLQRVMRKTLLLKGLDLARPCPGHESYTKLVHTSEEKKNRNNNRCRANQQSVLPVIGIVKYLFKLASRSVHCLDVVLNSQNLYETKCIEIRKTNWLFDLGSEMVDRNSTVRRIESFTKTTLFYRLDFHLTCRNYFIRNTWFNKMLYFTVLYEVVHMHSTDLV